MITWQSRPHKWKNIPFPLVGMAGLQSLTKPTTSTIGSFLRSSKLMSKIAFSDVNPDGGDLSMSTWDDVPFVAMVLGVELALIVIE